MLRRWSAAALTALCGVLIAAVKIGEGAPGTAALLMAGFLVLGFVLSPLAFPRDSASRPYASPSPTAAASPSAASSAVSSASPDDRPVVYWRPGCVFCLRLRARLGADANRLRWVDIWQNPEAAAAVRSYTGGDETVPTVVIAGEAHINPDPSWLRDQILPA